MPKGKGHIPEQIVRLLRDVEAGHAPGRDLEAHEVLLVVKPICRSAYTLICRSERAPGHTIASPPLGRTWSSSR